MGPYFTSLDRFRRAVKGRPRREAPRMMRIPAGRANLQGPRHLLTGYLKAVWPDFCGSVFGVWAAPGGFKTIQKCGGRSPLHFWMVLKPPGAAQTPKTDPTNSGQIAFRYPGDYIILYGSILYYTIIYYITQ